MAVKRQKAPSVQQGTLNLSRDAQQSILDKFAQAFCKKPESLTRAIQTVKGHLFDRNFDEAFGSEGHREAYAARWSPGRAVGYADILQEVFSEGLTRDILCVGAGGGAEWAAVQATPGLRLSLCTLVDIADWSDISQRLGAPVGSFVRQNVLDSLPESFLRIIGQCGLITFFFTLNELCNASVASTTRLLLALTDSVSQGTKLLVIDSPGSYSTVRLGSSAERQYPMHWLLDHILLLSASNTTPRWHKLHEQTSRWCRLHSGLRYPLALEDMRCQIHLYERV